MDLLEIRKKAKEKKEAEAKAALEAGKAAPSGDENPPAEEGPAPEAPRPKKKKSGKKKKPVPADGAKAPEKAAADVEAAPVSEDIPLIIDLAADDEAAAAEEMLLQEAAREEEAAARSVGPAEPALTELPAEEPVITEEGPGEEEEIAEAEDMVIEYLAFMLSDEEYAVKVEDVKEIIRLQRITNVPRAEEFVEGIISLRGVIIPVYDIKKRLGLEMGERQRTTRIVIISGDGSLQGIIVDKVTGVARLAESTIEPPPAVIGGVEGEYLDGVGRIGDRLLILFNTDRVLSLDSGVER